MVNHSSMQVNPQAEGFFQPAEWSPHEAVWLAWPTHRELWLENLENAQHELRSLCQAIADVHPGTQKAHGESLWVLVADENAEIEAKRALESLPVRFFRCPYGDIWLRDTAPLGLMNSSGERATVRFAFNGWGKKYILSHDGELAGHLAEQLGPGFRPFQFPWVLEGGSVEVDGEGTCLTSRQCLLNSNRNPEMTQEMVESGLKMALGVQKILWLNEGLKNDHTDGHIDTIARFAAPGVVLCMRPSGVDDPNGPVFREIKESLESMLDAKGRALTVIEVPSPGAIFDREGNLMPASYLNFYISNTRVIVPLYGSEYDQEALQVIRTQFPDRQTVGLMAKAILEGGGAFHCITQQVPI